MALTSVAITALLAGCIDGPGISFLMPDGSMASTFENGDIRIEFEYEDLDVFMKMTNLMTDQKMKHIWKPDSLVLPDGSKLSMLQLLTTSKGEFINPPEATRNADGSINTDALKNQQSNFQTVSKRYNISQYGRTINPVMSTRYLVGLVKDFFDESYKDTDGDIFIKPFKVLSECEPGDKLTLTLAYAIGPDFTEERTVDIGIIITEEEGTKR